MMQQSKHVAAAGACHSLNPFTAGLLSTWRFERVHGCCALLHFAGLAPNAAPDANSDTFPNFIATPGTFTDLAVLSNDGDPDADALSIVLVAPPPLLTTLGAQVTVTASNTLRYTVPAAGLAVGVGQYVDRFSYTASDGRGGFDSTTVAVTGECWRASHQAAALMSALDSVMDRSPALQFNPFVATLCGSGAIRGGVAAVVMHTVERMIVNVLTVGASCTHPHVSAVPVSYGEASQLSLLYLRGVYCKCCISQPAVIFACCCRAVPCAAVIVGNRAPVLAPVVTKTKRDTAVSVTPSFADPDGDPLASLSLVSVVGPSGLTVVCTTSSSCVLASGDGSVRVDGSGAGSSITWSPATNGLPAVSGSVVITYTATDSRGAQATGTVTINCESCWIQI
jgi:hypothetical protein